MEKGVGAIHKVQQIVQGREAPEKWSTLCRGVKTLFPQWKGLFVPVIEMDGNRNPEDKKKPNRENQKKRGGNCFKRGTGAPWKPGLKRNLSERRNLRDGRKKAPRPVDD